LDKLRNLVTSKIKDVKESEACKLNVLKSMDFVVNNEKETRNEIIKYSRSMSLELYKKGPKSIDVNLKNDGFVVTVHEPYNKTEMSLLEWNDPILTGAIMAIRCRTISLCNEELEQKMGEILKTEVRMKSPKFDTENMSILYEFEYSKK